MKTKFILLTFILVFFYIGVLSAQITVSAQRASLMDSDRAVLDQRISRYTAFTIDKQQLTNYLNDRGGAGQFRLRINENMDWTIRLELNDLRTPDFRITYTTDEGEFECKEPFVVNTFHGRTSTGMPVAFTIDKNTFFGVILGENYHYTIRSANDYTQNRSDTRLIAYHSWDIIPNGNYSHFIHEAINDALHTPKKILEEWIEQSSSNNCSFVLRIATVADIEFFNIHRESTANHIRSIINIMSAIYQAQITNLRLAISFQHVYRPGSSQSYTANNAWILLNQLRNHWRTAPNRTNVSRNIVHLFTGKNTYDPNSPGMRNLGAAWANPMGIGNDNGYAFSVNHASLTAIVAHEIGHNLTATHPPRNICNCHDQNTATIMCDRLTWANNLWFCQYSLDQMISYLNSVSVQLIDIYGNPFICNTVTYSLCNPSRVAFWEVSDGFTITWPPLPFWTPTNSVTVRVDGTHGQAGTLTAEIVAVPHHVVSIPIHACLICINGTLHCTGWCHLCSPPGNCPCHCRCCYVAPCWECGGFDNCRFCPCYSPSGFRAFPNPVSDILTIDLTQAETFGARTRSLSGVEVPARTNEVFYIRLFNAHGMIVRQQRTQAATIQFDVSNLPEGTYYLHIEHNGEIEKHQIIINRN